MPEPEPSRSRENLQLVGIVLSVSGVLTLAGAGLAYVTGENTGETRTHFDAAMVLAVLGVVLLVAAVVLFLEYRQRYKTAREDEKPGRWYPPDRSS